MRRSAFVRWSQATIVTVVIGAARDEVSAQVSIAPGVLRPSGAGILPSVRAKLSALPTGGLHTSKCLPYYGAANADGTAQFVIKPDKNPEAVSLEATLGVLANLLCQSAAQYAPGSDTVPAAQQFDFGSFYLGAGFKAGSNQRGTEVGVAPQINIVYINDNKSYWWLAVPSAEGSLAANRPLRSALRDSTHSPLAWERRWDATLRWRIPMASRSSAWLFEPVQASYSAHFYSENAQSSLTPSLGAGALRQASISLAPWRSWTRIASLDVAWTGGSLPEQPSPQRAWSISVTVQ